MNTEKKVGTTTTKGLPKDLPAYCDFTCRYAAFAPPESVGACRREQAVHCTLLRQFNQKNSPCKARLR
ncbi:MAG TPA: hypothetical protein VMM37_09330 [Bacteroidota bacterium]|nr:hypothetical protein [Bacteroidota bacterium]